MKISKIASALVLILTCTSLSAQRFKPTDNWPYLYEDFQSGVVASQNAPLAEGKFNIPVNGLKLHYIKNDVIMEIPAYQVKTVNIGDDLYIAVPNILMRVLLYDKNGYVLTHPEVDMEALNAVEIGYGIKSNTTSAQNINMSALGEIGVDLVNQNYMDISPDRKKKGKELPVKSKTYIFVNNHLIEAGRSDILKDSGIEKSVMNAFLKQNKINFRDEGSLLKVVDFIATQGK